MFALASRGEGGAAPFISSDVIRRARPQTCGARRISCRPPFTRAARCHYDGVCCEPKNKIIQPNVITMNEKTYYVYIEANKRNRVFYVGITNNIVRRDKEHENKVHKYGYTARYNVNKLVYYEKYHDVNKAIAREKSLKGINRQKKRDIVRAVNPKYDDLSEAWAREFRTPADAEGTTS